MAAPTSPTVKRRAEIDAAPAWVTCEHDVKICAGPSPDSMKPTGLHPDCFGQFLRQTMMGGPE